MMGYITYEQFNKNLDEVRTKAAFKILEIQRQMLKSIQEIGIIPNENIEIGLKNYNDWSNRNIDIDEFKKMLKENYHDVIFFCFDKSEFAK